MCQKTISMCQGKGSLSHNNRAFAAKNIDSSRTADNITFVHQNLSDAYDILFSDAVERLKLSITLDTLTARILKLSSDSQS